MGITIDGLQPWFFAVSAAFSFTTFGFILTLLKPVRDISQVQLRRQFLARSSWS
jgi:hypothetical protein